MAGLAWRNGQNRLVLVVASLLAAGSLSGCLGVPQVAPPESDAQPRSAPVQAKLYSQADIKRGKLDPRLLNPRLSPRVEDMTDHIRCEIIDTYFDNVYIPELYLKFSNLDVATQAPTTKELDDLFIEEVGYLRMLRFENAFDNEIPRDRKIEIKSLGDDIRNYRDDYLAKCVATFGDNRSSCEYEGRILWAWEYYFVTRYAPDIQRSVEVLRQLDVRRHPYVANYFEASPEGTRMAAEKALWAHMYDANFQAAVTLTLYVANNTTAGLSIGAMQPLTYLGRKESNCQIELTCSFANPSVGLLPDDPKALGSNLTAAQSLANRQAPLKTDPTSAYGLGLTLSPQGSATQDQTITLNFAIDVHALIDNARAYGEYGDCQVLDKGDGNIFSQPLLGNLRLDELFAAGLASLDEGPLYATKSSKAATGAAGGAGSDDAGSGAGSSGVGSSTFSSKIDFLLNYGASASPSYSTLWIKLAGASGGSGGGLGWTSNHTDTLNIAFAADCSDSAQTPTLQFTNGGSLYPDTVGWLAPSFGKDAGVLRIEAYEPANRTMRGVRQSGSFSSRPTYRLTIAGLQTGRPAAGALLQKYVSGAAKTGSGTTVNGEITVLQGKNAEQTYPVDLQGWFNLSTHELNLTGTVQTDSGTGLGSGATNAPADMVRLVAQNLYPAGSEGFYQLELPNDPALVGGDDGAPASSPSTPPTYWSSLPSCAQQDLARPDHKLIARSQAQQSVAAQTLESIARPR